MSTNTPWTTRVVGTKGYGENPNELVYGLINSRGMEILVGSKDLICLVSAAPELLEALKRIVNAVAVCTDDHGNCTGEVCQTDDFSAAREAIRKAEGA